MIDGTTEHRREEEPSDRQAGFCFYISTKCPGEEKQNQSSFLSFHGVFIHEPLCAADTEREFPRLESGDLLTTSVFPRLLRGMPGVCRKQRWIDCSGTTYCQDEPSYHHGWESEAGSKLEPIRTHSHPISSSKSRFWFSGSVKMYMAIGQDICYI